MNQKEKCKRKYTDKFSRHISIDSRTNVHYNKFIAVLEFGLYEGDEAHELQEINY